MNRSERFKQARANLGLSHREFAKLIGLSHKTVEKLQRDETAWATIKAQTVDKIEAFYDSYKCNDVVTEPAENVTQKETVVEKTGTNISTTSKDEKTLTLIEFVYEGLNESKTHKEFMANINMLKRIISNY